MSSSAQNNQDTIPETFTLKGLKDYFLENIDIESHSDVAIDEIFGEFLFRLFLKSRETSDTLGSCGINFFWAVHMEQAILDPADSYTGYNYQDSNGEMHHGLNALLAGIRDEIDIDSIVGSYWLNKDRHISVG